MSALTTATKEMVVLKAAKTRANATFLRRSAKVVRPIASLGVRAAKPEAKRRTRKRAQRARQTLRAAVETIAAYGPALAHQMGLVEPPKEKRTAPQVAAGVVVAASAVYFLDPEHGRERRASVAKLVA